jgi:transposase
MAKGARRDRQREVEWRHIVREQARSGLSIREFCTKSKLAESAFYFWRRELARRQAEQEQRRERPHAFLPVRVAEDPLPVGPGRIEIVLSSGRRVHVTAPVDRQVLADVLAVLEG